MTVNSHLYPQLDAYTQLAAPGFAILVNAPWGAGKTYQLEKWRSKRHDALYTSLFGAKNSQEVEEYLVQSLLDSKDVKLSSQLTKIVGDAVDRLTGVKFDLNGAFRRMLLKNLPAVLVFDDLERADMPLNELLGAINRFVEHEGKSVILLANQAELQRKDEEVYQRTKEKLIGRTVSIVPDASSALGTFLMSVKQDQSLETSFAFLKKNEEILASVFSASQSSNLRLFRYAILEFSRCYERIPVDLRSNETGMRSLLATFVALSISFHGNDGLSIDELRQEGRWTRAVWHVNGRRGEPPPETPLEKLQSLFSEHQLVQLHGQVISGDLAVAWIGMGYAEDGLLTAELRDSSVFRAEESHAWKTLWWWTKRPSEDVAQAVDAVKQQLVNREFRDPLIIMHLTGVMLSLADASIGWRSRNEVKKSMLTYLDALVKESLLGTDVPGRRWRNAGFDSGAFGLEFQKRESLEFGIVREKLEEALDRSFWSVNPQRVKEILGFAKSDPEKFAQLICIARRKEGVPCYSDEPIFVDVKPIDAAEVFFSLDPAVMQDVLGLFQARIQHLDTFSNGYGPDGGSETEWLLSVRKAGYVIASKSPSIRAAQIRKAIEWHLSFLDVRDEKREEAHTGKSKARRRASRGRDTAAR